ncbi:UDP-N-acetylmuramate--L-alanine ligase [Flavonifractor sp. An100]|uniref:UDP-N-acetylmuramate--L-alanine ligase n=1 Tax=Flavonifractor sp. An100 TaxID=1965538 RepID=UPI000B3A0BF9|nr:UDP-N-acetylmuramate--L-alanine ligase [Flavonifractor sp. An100]OUQ78194.1 UDP-N-acetylmuramate--L-alanine ligase [Flavonifractor sp. An100]
MAFSIQDYIRPDRRAHLVGIGGVSMSPLAEVLQGRGLIVTGSDLHESDTVAHLRTLGIPVTIGHLPQSVEGADCVIRTAAVHDDNPEIAAALQAGIPVFERAQAWGAIMRHYQNALCVAGTHGKTTTTSMCTHIFLAAQRDPSVMIGGVLPALGAGHRVGHGDTIILESCEYCNSFLSFFPTVAVILNVDADHLDFFKDLEDIKHSFRRFAQLVPQEGFVVADADDENTMDALKDLDRTVVTFGLEQGDVHAANLTWEKGFPSFDVIIGEKPFARVALSVPGIHNVGNALAAAAAAHCLGVPAAAVEEGLAAFHGAGRRFEKKGEYRGAMVYDDYAHHPQELHALLSTVKGLGYKRVICAFQPHTYTRTHELFDEFVQVLKLPDVTVLAEIFAAREQNTLNISSNDLARQIPGAIFCPTLEEVTQTLQELARPGDLILTVGAGDIYLAGEALVKAGE